MRCRSPPDTSDESYSRTSSRHRLILTTVPETRRAQAQTTPCAHPHDLNHWDLVVCISSSSFSSHRCCCCCCCCCCCFHRSPPRNSGQHVTSTPLRDDVPCDAASPPHALLTYRLPQSKEWKPHTLDESHHLPHATTHFLTLFLKNESTIKKTGNGKSVYKEVGYLW